MKNLLDFRKIARLAVLLCISSLLVVSGTQNLMSSNVLGKDESSQWQRAAQLHSTPHFANAAHFHNASNWQQNGTTAKELKLSCPLTQCVVINPFQLGKHKWSAGHRGVDLSTTAGRGVYAPADGEVIYAGLLVDRNVVSLRHTGDFRSTFEPVLPLVSQGDTVKRGDLIAFVTDRHCKDRQCLHWGLKRGSDDYLNPMHFLQRKRVRLLR